MAASGLRSVGWLVGLTGWMLSVDVPSAQLGHSSFLLLSLGQALLVSRPQLSLAEGCEVESADGQGVELIGLVSGQSTLRQVGKELGFEEGRLGSRKKEPKCPDPPNRQVQTGEPGNDGTCDSGWGRGKRTRPDQEP